MAGVFMAFPALLGLGLFVALPFGLAIILSFTNLRLGSPLPVEYFGLEQYRRIFADDSFRRALLNNLVFAGIVAPLQATLALALALWLNRPLRAMPLFRTMFFMPVAFPMALVAVVWELLYAPGPDGLLNSFLHWASLGAWTPRDFLHDSAWAMPAIMALSIWQGVGLQMVVLLAGLQAIPGVLYEAAAIDRAGAWSRFVHVTLPQMRNPLVFVLLVTCVLAFRLFDQVDILTHGGPNDATTTVMYESVTTVFSKQQVGRASAMTVVFFVIVLAITWLQRMVARQERQTG